jgi:hypothetical protein
MEVWVPVVRADSGNATAALTGASERRLAHSVEAKIP